MPEQQLSEPVHQSRPQVWIGRLRDPSETQTQHNITKFYNQLKVLQKVESLTLKIGESTLLLVPWILEKIDSNVSKLPQLKFFSFSGFADMPSKFDFPFVKLKIGRDDMVMVSIKKK